MIYEKAIEHGAEGIELKAEQQMIVLSAKNEERLKAYAKAMVDYITRMEKQEIQNPKS